MRSMPIEVAKLGLGFDDYFKMARNVGRVLNMRESWDSIFERANSELPRWASDIGIRLPRVMSYDREFFNEADLEYSAGPPIQGCFSVAVADYMLRNRDRLKFTSLD